MSWGKRWTAADLQAHLAGRAAVSAPVPEKKITLEQAAVDKDERRKFRDHKPTGKHEFCESFMKEST